MNFGKEMINCSFCGKEVNADAKFCPYCGKIIEKPKFIEVIRCRKCGAKMNEDSAFCPECGNPVIEEEQIFKEPKISKSIITL